MEDIRIENISSWLTTFGVRGTLIKPCSQPRVLKWKDVGDGAYPAPV